MDSNLKYITDEKGQKVNVIVPIEIWKDITDKFNKLSRKLQILTGIEKGLNEVKSSNKSGKKLQTLSDFLHESNR